MQDKIKDDNILEGLTSYWTDRAKSYSVQNIAEMNDWRQQAWRKLILSYAPPKECLRILDVGTGPGFFAINLAMAGHNVTAVDVTEEMLFHAKENAKSYGTKVNFILHRGEFLPFEDNSFDLIVSRNVILSSFILSCIFLHSPVFYLSRYHLLHASTCHDHKQYYYKDYPEKS